MFYVLIFSILAVVLIVAGLTTMSRRRRNLEYDEVPSPTAAHPRHEDAQRRARKAKRAQSQHDRRRRH